MNRMAPSFGDFFFNNVFVTPGGLDAGTVAPGDYVDFELWHSFPDVKQLNGVSESGGDDIELSGQASGTLFSFNALSYRVFLNQKNGGLIEYQAAFDISGVAVAPFVLNASMAMELPELIDWSTSPVMLVQYLTETIQSFNGAEQRIALRDKPRVSVSYQYSLVDEERYQFDSKFINFNSDIIVPVWPMQVYSDRDIFEGDGSFALSDVNSSIQTSDLFLLTDGVNSEIVSVAEVVGREVSLKRLVKKNYKAPRLIPCKIGSQQDQSNSYTRSNFLDVHSMSFDLDPGMLVRAAPIDDFQRLGGTAIMPFRPDRSQDISTQYSRLRETLDPGIGVRNVHSRTAGAIRVFSYGFRFFSETERQRFEDFAELNAGSQGEFWFEAPAVSAEIQNDIFESSQQLTTKSSGYFQLAKSKSFAPGLAIKLYNGTTIYRTIVSASRNNDGTEVLILNEPLENLKVSDVDYIAPLYLGRFDTDDFTYTFQTTSVSTITKTIKQLIYADPETN